MDKIRIKKVKFEETIKTIFYEYLMKHIPKERNNMTIYDKIRQLVENSDNIIGCKDYQSTNVNYKEGNVAVGVASYKFGYLQGKPGLQGTPGPMGKNGLMGKPGVKKTYHGIGYQHYDIFQENNTNYRYELKPIYCYTGNDSYALNISFLPKNFKVEISYDTLYVFCYYLNFHDSSTLINIQKHLQLYSQYKSTFTLIGATMISKANFNIKQKMIKDLLKAGWKPTTDDLDLLLLTIYNTHVDKISLLKYIYIDDIYRQLIYHMIQFTYHDYL